MPSTEAPTNIPTLPPDTGSTTDGGDGGTDTGGGTTDSGGGGGGDPDSGGDTTPTLRTIVTTPTYRGFTTSTGIINPVTETATEYPITFKEPSTTRPKPILTTPGTQYTLPPTTTGTSTIIIYGTWFMDLPYFCGYGPSLARASLCDGEQDETDQADFMFLDKTTPTEGTGPLPQDILAHG